ncbi:DUF86 domain-containing protein [Novosphingobium sp.]|uniref:HepT-like ribonuclease domain-containing protein n=1 Tax=Novosphingobium sp. TaxID=1874826 RepID=UPI0025DAD2BA|nr:DUF86 domain-containing protein [Novosphingobium sp.]MCC6924305.1 DUF86 domain-containing protein [Novosphingobium sp.]
MSVPSAEQLLQHMRDAISQTLTYIEGYAKEDFLEDKRTQQAVILNLIILGEAATKLMDSYPDQTAARPEIEWRSMRGMRNRIAHGYYDIDLDVVWETVSVALPELSKLLDNSGN